MIRKIHVRNFKSIVDLEMDLGRVNVLIGENGSGKSNVLEALAFAGAAAANKLDNEFMTSRGIRVTEGKFMRSSFDSTGRPEIIATIMSDSDSADIEMFYDVGRSGSHPIWRANVRFASDRMKSLFVDKTFIGLDDISRLMTFISHSIDEDKEIIHADKDTAMKEKGETLRERAQRRTQLLSQFSFVLGAIDGLAGLLGNFLIYSPENSALRTFEREGQILPLGIRGEGLFKLLYTTAREFPDAWAELRENLSVLDWFDDLAIGDDLVPFEQRLRIKDRFLVDGGGAFDQRSSNEGFLFLLFYFALFISRDTPAFFAIDNIDTSLNPKVCRELMRRLSALAEKHGKQAIFTTHNPSVLDGLNLHDDEQRLFVVSRTRDGHTRARRVLPPQPVDGEAPVKLSEAFVGGLLGGLPKNF